MSLKNIVWSNSILLTDCWVKAVVVIHGPLSFLQSRNLIEYCINIVILLLLATIVRKLVASDIGDKRGPSGNSMRERSN